MGSSVILTVFALLAPMVAGTVFDVVAFGAVGDGLTDDTQAFNTSWYAACDDPSSPTLLIPASKTFLLSHIKFQGHCKSSIHIQVLGNLVAPDTPWLSPGINSWITFYSIDNLTIDGPGTIDGRGARWWDCKFKNNCPMEPPMLFAIYACNNLSISGLNFLNSPNFHLTLYGSHGVQISGISATAPADSPNTDAMHIQQCQHVQVLNSTFQTGDDCIGIGTNTTDLNITYINCGPGHGISIGSLGYNGTRETVERVHVSHCNFYNTKNGIRIKSWQGAAGYVRDIRFDHIHFSRGVQYPIIFDQFYCPVGNCPNKTTTMQYSDIWVVGARGKTTSNPAITLACSNETPCTSITLHDIIIHHETEGMRPTSYCHNAQGSLRQPIYPPVPCLE